MFRKSAQLLAGSGGGSSAHLGIVCALWHPLHLMLNNRDILAAISICPAAECAQDRWTVKPIPLKRVFFWVCYVLGTINLAFGLLLGLVPRARHSPHYGGDLLVWAICLLILFACYFLARKMFDPACQEKEGVPGNAYIAFRVLATAELVFVSFKIVILLIYFIFRNS
jgi:hypothetical protein